MKPKEEQFFQDCADEKFILVVAFRNSYGELFCLYRLTEKPYGDVYITGDELDWNYETILNYHTASIKDFYLSIQERAKLLALTDYIKQ